MTSLRNRTLGNGLYLISQISRKTGRYHVEGLPNFEQARNSQRPVIWVAWHGMTMMLAGWVLRHYDAGSLLIMMPDDWRGEVLGQFATRIGATPAKMNLKGDTSMATARKLAQMVRKLKEGWHAYITPDGPDGPPYIIKPGVAYLAQKSDAILLPVGAFTRSGVRINRWDQYMVPWPFSRISVVISEPLEAPQRGELTAITEPLTDALHRTTARAISNYFGPYE